MRSLSRELAQNQLVLRLHSGQCGSSVLGTGLPRTRALGIAVAAALLLHGGLLLWRPDVSASSHLIGPRVMAVRLLPSHAVDALALAGGETDPLPGRGPGDAVSAGAAEASQAPTRLHADQRRSTRPGASAAVKSPAGRASQASRPDAELAPAPDYLMGARLDPGPRPLGAIEPEYPEAANLQEGMVVLRLLISETGVVDDAAIVRSDPTGVFDQAAVDAFKQARFSPGMVLGTPVKSQITVQVEFVPINRGARISGRMY